VIESSTWTRCAGRCSSGIPLHIERLFVIPAPRFLRWRHTTRSHACRSHVELGLTVSRLEQLSRLSSVEQPTTTLTHSRGDNFAPIKSATLSGALKMPRRRAAQQSPDGMPRKGIQNVRGSPRSTHHSLSAPWTLQILIKVSLLCHGSLPLAMMTR
jgi:hypothetical protein